MSWRDAGPRPNPWVVLWRCLTCDAHWWASEAGAESEDWPEQITCQCRLDDDPSFEVVDLAEPGPGQRALL